MFTGGGSFYDTGDKTLLSDFISALAQLAVSRAASICHRLWSSLQAQDQAQAQAKPQAPLPDIDLAAATAEVVDQVLGSHLDLCFGVHLSVIVACSVFSVAKATRTGLQFKAILQDMSAASSASYAVLDSLSVTMQHRALDGVFASVVWSAEGGEDCGGQGPQHGGCDIRHFYNNVFLQRIEGRQVCGCVC